MGEDDPALKQNDINRCTLAKREIDGKLRDNQLDRCV